jgi:hypothetical protein
MFKQTSIKICHSTTKIFYIFSKNNHTSHFSSTEKGGLAKKTIKRKNSPTKKVKKQDNN